MHVDINFVVQLIASVFTLLASWQYGNKRVAGPLLGLASQFPWWTLMVMNGLWGLFPLNIAMTTIHVRNLWKWWRE